MDPIIPVTIVPVVGVTPPIVSDTVSIPNPTPSLPSVVTAIATYMNRKGGDGNDFLNQYKTAQKAGGARLREVDAKVEGLASSMQEQIQNAGTYYQHKDILASLKPSQTSKSVALPVTSNAKQTWQSLHQTPLLKPQVGDELSTGEDAVNKLLNALPRIWKSYVDMAEAVPDIMLSAGSAAVAGISQAGNALANLTNDSGDNLNYSQRRALLEYKITGTLPGERTQDPLLRKTSSELKDTAEKLRHLVDGVTLPEKPMEAAFSPDGSFNPGAIPGMTGQALGDLSVIMATGGMARMGAAKELTALARIGNVSGLIKAEETLAAANKSRAFVIGTIQGFHPSLEAGKAAGLSDGDASLMASVLAPLMGHLDAAAGVEGMVNPTVLAKLKGEALQKVLLQAGGDLTASNFNEVSKGLISGYQRRLASLAMRGKNFGKATLAEGFNEGGTQQLAEKAVEQIYNYTLGSGGQPGQGQYEQSLAGTAADMANDFVAGGLAGGIGGGTFYKGNLIEPTLYKQIDSAVQSGQNLDMILSGFRPTLDALSQSGVTQEHRAQIEQNIGQMVEVAHGLAAHPNLSPLARYTYFQTSQQLPQFQNQLAGIQEAKAQLPDMTQQLADLDNQPDTADVIAQRAALGQQIGEANARLAGIDENAETKLGRKIAFLKKARNQVITENKELGLAGPLSYIDQFTEGDNVVDEQGNEHRITDISPDGQMLATENGQLSAASVRPAGAPVSNLDPAAEVVPPMGLITFDQKPITAYKAGDGLFFVGADNQVQQVEFVAHDPATDTLTVSLPNGTQEQFDFGEIWDNGDVLGGYDPNAALDQADVEAQQSELDNQLQSLRDKLSPEELTALNNFSEADIPAQIRRLRGKNTKASTLQADYLQLRAEKKGIVLPEETSDALANDTPSKELVYAPEVLTNEEIQGIIETGEVPQPIIDEIALALLANTKLSEWQTKILDEDGELVNEAAYRLTDQLANEKTQQVSDPNRQPANRSTEGGTRAPASAGADPANDNTTTTDSGQREASVAIRPEPVGQSGPAIDGSLDPGSPDPGTAASTGGRSTTSLTPQTRSGKVRNFQLDEDGVQPVVEESPISATAQSDSSGQPREGQGLIQIDEAGVPIDTVRVVIPGRGLLRAAVLAYRNGWVKVQFAGANSKPVTKYVPVNEVRSLTNSQMGHDEPVAFSGSSPVQNSQTATVGETVTILVPELGADLRSMEVITVATDGLTLGVRSPKTGKTFAAYADDIMPGIMPTPPIDIKDAGSRGRIMRSMGSDVPASPVAGPVLIRLIDQLAKAFPKINVEVVSDARMVEDFADTQGRTPLGAYQNGTVYLNADLASLTTPLHEYSHLWKQILASKYPSRWKRGQLLVKGSVYEQQVRKAYPDLTSEDDVLEEALVQAIEDQGLQFIDENGNVNIPSPTTRLGQFKQWLADSFRKVADSTGWSWLSPDATLEDWAKHEAKELLGGNVLSDMASADLSNNAPAKLAVYPPGQALPTQVDETILSQYTFSLDHRKELFDPAIYTVGYDALGNLIRQRADLITDRKTVANTHQAIQRTKDDGGVVGNALKTVTSKLTRDLYAHSLTLPTLSRWVFGLDDTGGGRLLNQTLIESRRKTADLINQNGDFMDSLYAVLSPTGRQSLSNFKGLIDPSEVKQLSLPTTVGSISISASEALTLAARYETIMADYGGFGTRNGQPITDILLTRPNPDNPDIPLTYSVSQADLRHLKRQVYDDPELRAILQSVYPHLDASFPVISQTHLMTEGKRLTPSSRYFPLRVAKTEQEISARKVNQIIEDIALLKSRQGPPANIWIEDLATVLERYHRQTETYVQHQALAKNLQHILSVHGQTLKEQGQGWLYRALETKFTNASDPNALTRAQQGSGFFSGLERNLQALVRLATLSRFTRNISIRMSQFGGFVSAFGNGQIKDEYLRAELLPTAGLIGKSYGLGDFNVQSDQLKSGLSKILANPYAGTIQWRVRDDASPDVQYANLDRVDLAQNPGPVRRWFMRQWKRGETYGLAGQRIADRSVIVGIYEAAEKQVMEEDTHLSADKQQKKIAQIAEHAVYYSNQTLDITDRSGIQSSGNFLIRMLGLYQGQGFKLFDTMARRNVEAAIAPVGSLEREEAESAWYKSLRVNILYGGLMKAGTMALAGVLRNGLYNALVDDEHEKWPTWEDAFWNFFDGTVQTIPILGNLLSDAAFSGKTGNALDLTPDPAEPAIKAVTSVVKLLAYMTPVTKWNSARQKKKAVSDEVYQAIRSVPEATGLAGQEEARQAATLVRWLTAPAPGPKRKEPQKSGWGMDIN